MIKGGAMGKIKLFSLIFILFILTGCLGVQEVARGVAGVSTKVLEDTRKDAIRKQFNFDLVTTHNKVRRILRDNGAYIYADDLGKDLIAVYVSEADTTPVGIFFKEINPQNTLIEVSSPSTFGKEFIAGLISDGLEGKLKPKIKKGESDEKKKIFGD
ncbi:MAG: hypothetical protein NTW13_04240 [Candidatus Omnitrophica bacterium]|nr:hypothetical protein [Candidatus Omnitrophota bacterium]